MRVHLGLGELLYWRGRFDEAFTSFETALELDPGNRTALLGAAASLHTLGVESEAIYFYLSYLSENPKDVRALLSLAAAYQATKQYDAAVDAFKRAIELEPDDADIHGQYGRALYELGREKEAREHLGRARELGSMDTEVYRALGLMLEADEDRDGAEAMYERAVEIDPGNVAARLQLAALLTRTDADGVTRDAERGLEHATTALEIMSDAGVEARDRSSALWLIGWAHYVLGDWSASIRASREALEIDPGLTPVRFNLGLALLRSGDREAALEGTPGRSTRSTTCSTSASTASATSRRRRRPNPSCPGGARSWRSSRLATWSSSARCRGPRPRGRPGTPESLLLRAGEQQAAECLLAQSPLPDGI